MEKINFRKLFSMALLLGTCLLYQLPASAQPLDATCLGNADLQFSPPVKLLPKPTGLTGSGDMTCLFSEDLSSHTASLTGLVGNGNLSCLVNTDAVGNVLIEWDDQTDSLVNWQSVQVELFDIELGLPSVPRVFALQGDVVSGKFQGGSMLVTYNDIPTLAYLDCLFGGLQGIGGPVTVIFTQ